MTPFDFTLSRKHRIDLLIVCGTALYFFANIQRTAVPGAVFDLLQEKFRVSAPYVTGLGSMFMYVYAVMQLFAGILVDRFGGIRVVCVGASAFCAGELLFPLSDTLFLVYFARALTGLGAGILYLSLIKECMRVYRDSGNIAIALVIMVGFIGGVTANAPLVAAVSHFGFRNVFLAAAFLSLFFYLLFVAVVATMRLPRTAATPVPLFRSCGRLLSSKHNRWLFLFSGLNFGLYYVIQTVIGKKFLEDACAFRPERAALVLSIMGVISAVSGVALAFLSRRFGNRRRPFCLFCGIMCPAVFLLLPVCLACGIAGNAAALLFCALATTSSMSSTVIPLIRETNPREITVMP